MSEVFCSFALVSIYLVLFDGVGWAKGRSKIVISTNSGTVFESFLSAEAYTKGSDSTLRRTYLFKLNPVSIRYKRKHYTVQLEPVSPISQIPQHEYQTK